MGGDNLERKIHLVKWDIVYSSKVKGGLVSNFNKALLGKWNWRFAMEENLVWRNIISLKYGMEEGDGSLILREAVMGSSFGRILAKK